MQIKDSVRDLLKLGDLSCSISMCRHVSLLDHDLTLISYMSLITTVTDISLLWWHHADCCCWWHIWHGHIGGTSFPDSETVLTPYLSPLRSAWKTPSTCLSCRDQMAPDPRGEDRCILGLLSLDVGLERRELRTGDDLKTQMYFKCLLFYFIKARVFKLSKVDPSFTQTEAGIGSSNH